MSLSRQLVALVLTLTETLQFKKNTCLTVSAESGHQMHHMMSRSSLDGKKQMCELVFWQL